MSGDSDIVRRWEALTTVEVRDAIAHDPVVVMPLGAIEQHGPHLPLSTDVDIVEGLLDEAFRRLDADLPVYALPVQALGTSDEHGDFAGTLSLPSETLGAVIRATGASLARAGVRRFVIFNGHGGNRSVIDDAALRLRREFGLLVVKASYFRFPRPDHVVLPAGEWEHGLHGGAIETAMMLHLRPDVVRTDRVRDFRSLGEDLAGDLAHLRPEGGASFAWTAGDLNPEGVVGHAESADSTMGGHLVAHYGGLLAEVLADARAFPMDRLAARDES